MARIHRHKPPVAQPEDSVEAVKDALVVRDHDDPGLVIDRDPA